MGKYDNYIGRVYADRYEIISVVGTGGSAVVFGVYDSKEDRTVAMKMLKSEYENNEEAVSRFVKEAEVLSLFSHPQIVKIYDKYLDEFPKYFIMEYVEGITLQNHILSQITPKSTAYFRTYSINFTTSKPIIPERTTKHSLPFRHHRCCLNLVLFDILPNPHNFLITQGKEIRTATCSTINTPTMIGKINKFQGTFQILHALQHL